MAKQTGPGWDELTSYLVAGDEARGNKKPVLRRMARGDEVGIFGK